MRNYNHTYISFKIIIKNYDLDYFIRIITNYVLYDYKLIDTICVFFDLKRKKVKNILGKRFNTY